MQVEGRDDGLADFVQRCQFLVALLDLSLGLHAIGDVLKDGMDAIGLAFVRPEQRHCVDVDPAVAVEFGVEETDRDVVACRFAGDEALFPGPWQSGILEETPKSALPDRGR